MPGGKDEHENPACKVRPWVNLIQRHHMIFNELLQRIRAWAEPRSFVAIAPQDDVLSLHDYRHPLIMITVILNKVKDLILESL